VPGAFLFITAPSSFLGPNQTPTLRVLTRGVTKTDSKVDQSLPPTATELCLRFPTRLNAATRNRRLRSLEARFSQETPPSGRFSNTCYLCDIWTVQHSRRHFLRRLLYIDPTFLPLSFHLRNTQPFSGAKVPPQLTSATTPEPRRPKTTNTMKLSRLKKQTHSVTKMLVFSFIFITCKTVRRTTEVH
jgi:hypothetical protein